ncbi:hypothetical protein G6F31_019209 [Rhizopus arrhizus]|nr:hypothetical protein G6F31_019209 [Rhizopus arrhizus]
MEARLLDKFQHRKAGRHRHRVAAQRASLVDRSGRGDLLHQLTTTAIGTDRHAAADDLAEGGQVRGDAVVRLRTAKGNAEAGHHLVEDQQRAVLRAQFAQVLQVTLARGNAVGVADHRFDDQAGDVVTLLFEQCGGGFEVGVGQGQGQLAQPGRNTR